MATDSEPQGESPLSEKSAISSLERSSRQFEVPPDSPQLWILFRKGLTKRYVNTLRALTYLSSAEDSYGSHLRFLGQIPCQLRRKLHFLLVNEVHDAAAGKFHSVMRPNPPPFPSAFHLKAIRLMCESASTLTLFILPSVEYYPYIGGSGGTGTGGVPPAVQRWGSGD